MEGRLNSIQAEKLVRHWIDDCDSDEATAYELVASMGSIDKHDYTITELTCAECGYVTYSLSTRSRPEDVTVLNHHSITTMKQ